MIKKITKKLKLIVLSSLVISTSFAQSSLGRITFSSGGISSSGLSVTVGQSMAGSFKSEDGKTILTVGAQANIIVQDPVVSDELLIDKNSFIADSKLDSFLINVTSNISWSVSVTNSWISLSKTSGVNSGVFKIYLSENKSNSLRTGIVTIKGKNIERQITINQKGVVNEQDQLSISLLTLNLEAVKLDTTIKVSSNRSWTVSNSATWLDFKTTQGSGNSDVKFTVLANQDKVTRNAIVVFTAGSNTQFLNITQAANKTNGIEEMDFADLIKIFPNPVNTHLNVQLNKTLISNATLFIYDAIGKQISYHQATDQNTAIDVSGLASGDYILRVVSIENNINQQIKFNKIN